MAETGESKPCSGKSIMVIDDEHIVCKTLKIALGKLGGEIEVFQNPEDALKRIDEKSFDIVVTDVVMGDIDGIQILERVMEKNPSCKVIIMTAFAMMDLARKAMEKGAFDFIAKPFDSKEIREVVERAARELSSS